jgi:hypothetical protein
MNKNSQAHLWLTLLTSNPKTLVPIYKQEYESLRMLAPILPEKVVKDADGVGQIFYLHREKSIGILKDTYKFLTQKEATKELTEAAKEHHGP